MVLLLVSCSTAWQPVPDETVRLGGAHVYERILLVTHDGHERELTDAVIRPDSLVGMSTDSGQRRLAIPLSDVVRVESREHDATPALSAVGRFITDAGTE